MPLTALLLVAPFISSSVALYARQPALAKPPVEKVPIVAVTGCIAEEGGGWLLTNATTPEPSTAGASAKKDAAPPALGKGRFQLIGTSPFDLPSLKGHTVTLKGLQVKATPIDRVNVTSVTSLAASCATK